MNIARISMMSVAFVVLVLGFFAVRARAASNNIPQVGQMAPTFTLPSQAGTLVNIEHMRGHWVVLYFYPKDQTSGCTIEARKFQHDTPQYEALNAVVFGVSVDSVESHKKFAAKDSLNFKLLADPKGKVVASYGSLGNYMAFKIAKRNTFLIDPQGKIAKEWIGVDPSSHSEEVLAALKELQKK